MATFFCSFSFKFDMKNWHRKHGKLHIQQILHTLKKRKEEKKTRIIEIECDIIWQMGE